MTLLRAVRPVTRSASSYYARRLLTTVGIRKEDPGRIWERRTPLVPSAVADLVKPGQVDVEVESCQRRSFRDEEYKQAGAKIVEKLSTNVDMVLGIKEPPVPEVHRLIEESKGKRRTWMVFSHTHKGQPYNTGLLSAFVGKDKAQTLIDWELLQADNASGRRERVAAFGWYAGAVGAGEALTMTGMAQLKKGVSAPLMHLPRPYTFGTLSGFKEGLSKVGDAYRASDVSKEPLVIGITGGGNVSQGAKEMLDVLGVTWLDSDRLAAELASATPGRIYATMIKPESIFRNASNTYDREEYFTNPERYHSIFGKHVAPYLTTLINGQGWQSGFPRIMSNKDLAASGPSSRLIAVQDVTCDIAGNLEFMNQYTTIDDPYYEGPGGLMISSIDILPSELPWAELAKDASKHFSDLILPYVQHLARQETDQEKARSLAEATIVRSGEIRAPHQWLSPRVDQWRQEQSSPQSSSSSAGLKPKKKVLLLGSGLVAGPAADVLASRADVHVVNDFIASNDPESARLIKGDRQNIESILLDVGDEAATARAVSEVDVVVSLLPAPMHTKIAAHCIKHKKHLVTASYVSDEMEALDQQAKQSEITILGECGLDPGIDSMAAMRIIDRAKRERKKVTSFISWCGGLPEPSASNVPLRYKFSWSPKAVLTAALNDARYKLDGEVKKVQGQSLLESHFPAVKLWDDLPLEGLANRDSIPYAEKYGLGPVEGLKNLFRGTLRYQGFADIMDSFRRLGLLSTSPLSQRPESRGDLLNITGDSTSLFAKNKLSDATVQALEQFGLLSSGKASTDKPLPSQVLASKTALAPIDYLAAILGEELKYQPGERDTTLLHHAFVLEPQDPASGLKEQSVTASLVCYGDEKASAMAVTVGKTLGFAALRVLDGNVRSKGVIRPTERDVYDGVLDDLAEIGIEVEEKWS